MLIYCKDGENCTLKEMILKFPQIWNESVSEDITFWHNRGVNDVVDLIAEVTDLFEELLISENEIWECTGSIDIEDIIAVFQTEELKIDRDYCSLVESMNRREGLVSDEKLKDLLKYQDRALHKCLDRLRESEDRITQLSSMVSDYKFKLYGCAEELEKMRNVKVTIGYGENADVFHPFSEIMDKLLDDLEVDL